jgi:hypothetical protein
LETPDVPTAHRPTYFAFLKREQATLQWREAALPLKTPTISHRFIIYGSSGFLPALFLLKIHLREGM